MRLSARTSHVTADQDAQRAIRDLLRQLAQRLAGLVLAAAGEQGVIDMTQRATVLNGVRGIVEPVFVQRVPVAGQARTEEAAHLQQLIATAQAAAQTGTAEQRARATARARMLGERLAVLDGGYALVSLQNGRAVTPYARIIMTGAESVIRSTLGAHARGMERLLENAPELRAWLGTPIAVPRDLLLRFQPVALWQDARGYTLSDRIWAINEQTLSRIEALLDEGISSGRAAVSIADDLTQFLRASRRSVVTRKPYGIIGSFDARRLARSEITRSAGLSSYTAGITNPFVTRAYYHLSGVHDPKNCDGTCDDHAATSEQNDGYPPEAVPIPMVDTHPQCMCYITHGTGDKDAILAQLRAQMEQGAIQAEPAPVTPLLIDLLTAALLGWTVYQFATESNS